MNWKTKHAKIAAAMVGSLATYLATTGDIPDRPPDDLAVSLKGKSATERVMAKNFERKNAMPGEELTTLRTRYGKTRKLDSRGRVEAMISRRPLHWFDPDDSVYRDIDLTVHDIHPLAKLNPLKKIDKYVNAGQWQAGWSDNKPHDYIFIRDNLEVSYAALFDTSETLRVTTEAKPDGMKQSITVKNRGASKTVLAWRIKTNADSVRLERGGVAYYLDGVRAARVKAPVVWDDERRVLSSRYTLHGDTLTLAVEYPAKVSWPVTVDPTTTVDDIDDLSGCLVTYSGSVWTARDSSDASGLLADYSYLWFTGASQVNRILYRFDTSGLPDDVTIIGAALKFVVSDTTGKAEDFYLKIIEAQDSLDTAHLNASMYNEFKGWAAGGVAYSPTILSDSLSTAARAYGDTLTFTLNYIGNADISLTGTTQFFMVSGADMGRSPTPGGSQYMGFEDDSPYLYVTYYTTPNVPTLSITAVSDASVSLTIGANGNDSGVDYSIRITHPGGHQNYWDGSDTTATETFKTLAAWGAMPEVINNRLATNGEYWLDCRARNTAVYSAWVRIGARAWDKRLRNTISHLYSIGTMNIPTLGAYEVGRAVSTADSILVAGSSVGQNSGTFPVMRFHMDFRSLYSTVNIDACTLYVDLGSNNSATDFDINLYKNDWTQNLAEDLRHIHFDGYQPGKVLYAGTNLTDSPPSTSGISDPFMIVFNAAGLAYYNAHYATQDTMRFSLISAEDCAKSEPTGEEYITIDNDPLSNISLHIGRDSTEVGLANLVVTVAGHDTIFVTWSNGLGSNVALAFVDSATGVTIGDSLAYNATSCGIGGLAPNCIYRICLKIIGGISNGVLSSTAMFCTDPAPLLSGPNITIDSNTQVTVKIDTTGTGNPVDTEYAVYFRGIDGVTRWVDFDADPDTLKSSSSPLGLNDSWGWRTFSALGGVSGFAVHQMIPGHRDSAFVEGRTREY